MVDHRFSSLDKKKKAAMDPINEKINAFNAP